jgi:hypothetical protein
MGVLMSASAITVKNLGGEKIENEIRERLELELKNRPGFRVTILGSPSTEAWEIKVEKPPAPDPWRMFFTITDNEHIEMAVQLVLEGVASFP